MDSYFDSSELALQRAKPNRPVTAVAAVPPTVADTQNPSARPARSIRDASGCRHGCRHAPNNARSAAFTGSNRAANKFARSIASRQTSAEFAPAANCK